MKYSPLRILACCFALAIVATALAAPSIEIRLKNGSAWRGELNDFVQVKFVEQNVEIQLTGRLVDATKYYIKIDGELGMKTIFNGDIRSMRTVEANDAAEVTPGKKRGADSAAVKETVDDDAPGVFVLPLRGGVGEEFRHEEIEMIGEEADKYGPGQIIVLIINSNGGLVSESELITEAIWDLKKRHRVVAWVEKAISAGCSTAMACDEIYMMTEGTAGSVTTITGNLKHVPEKEVQPGIDYLVRIAKEAGRSEHIARSMKLKRFLCSYDKDPQTGEVTFYGDLSGEFVLSDAESNLCFNSSNALHCGFSDGTADTEEDLAKLLDLPRWYEKSDYGRNIAKQWRQTAEKANEEIPRMIARRSYWKTSGSVEERIGALIQIDLALIRWIERAPNLVGGLSKEALEREVKELRKQLADIKRAQRRR